MVIIRIIKRNVNIYIKPPLSSIPIFFIINKLELRTQNSYIIQKKDMRFWFMFKISDNTSNNVVENFFLSEDLEATSSILTSLATLT